MNLKFYALVVLGIVLFFAGIGLGINETFIRQSFSWLNVLAVIIAVIGFGMASIASANIPYPPYYPNKRYIKRKIRK